MREKMPEFKNSKAFEAWWWAEKNAKCLACALTCKQSSKAKLIACPQYGAK